MNYYILQCSVPSTTHYGEICVKCVESKCKPLLIGCNEFQRVEILDFVFSVTCSRLVRGNMACTEDLSHDVNY